MKVLKSLLSILFLITITGCQNVSVESPKEEPSTLEDDIYIFYTSDVHCGVDENLGFAGLKALVEDTKKEHVYVSLVDVGDYIQGGTLGSLTKGKAIIELMNAMNYDVVTIGNHEFDYGIEELSNRMHEMNCPIVASNVLYRGTKKNIFEDIPTYIMKEYGPIKVAFIGVLTPSSIITSTPKYFMEDGKIVYDFYSEEEGNALANHVQSIVDEARQNGADYVVALTHLGSTSAEEPYDSISFIHKTNGIDVVLDGHSHSVIIGDKYPNKDGEDVLLSSVGTKMQNVGELIIGKDGSLTTLLISEYNRKDEVIEKLITDKIAEQDLLLSEKVTEIPFPLVITDEENHRIVRSRETNLGDFVADAYREVMKADIGFANGGGVRASIPQGEVTLRNLLDVAPFQNTVGTCKASGQQILDALEFGCKETQGITVLDDNSVGESGAFLQVSGLKYTIDTSIPSGVVLDENNMMKEIVGERRVQDVMVLKDGEYVPLDPEETYLVAGISYILYDNGDGNTAFQDAEMVEQGAMIDVDAIRQYLEQNSGNLEQYQNPFGEGRITVK